MDEARRDAVPLELGLAQQPDLAAAVEHAPAHQRLQKDAMEWCQYHTLYQQHRKDWPLQPIEEISKWLKQRTGWVVADLGCGEDLLRESVSDSHEVLSFDHVAINEHVTACDLSALPVAR